MASSDEKLAHGPQLARLLDVLQTELKKLEAEGVPPTLLLQAVYSAGFLLMVRNLGLDESMEIIARCCSNVDLPSITQREPGRTPADYLFDGVWNVFEFAAFLGLQDPLEAFRCVLGASFVITAKHTSKAAVFDALQRFLAHPPPLDDPTTH